MKLKSFVYVKSPRSGMANRFLVWAKAKIISHRYCLDFRTSEMFSLHIGPILRRENSKRFYYDYFIKQSLFNKISTFLRIKLLNKNYNLSYDDNFSNTNNVYIFDKLDWIHYFDEIRLDRKYLIKEFYKLINPKYLVLDKFETPVVSIHIRRGDFKIGYPLTPNNYFADCIDKLRNIVGYMGLICVFTDANQDEIYDILSLNRVQLFNSGNDLQDMLMLSKSKVIYVSNGSTYSYWSAFISDAIIIRYDQDNYGSIREGANLYEYFWPSDYISSIDNLKKVLT